MTNYSFEVATPPRATPGSDEPIAYEPAPASLAIDEASARAPELPEFGTSGGGRPPTVSGGDVATGGMEQMIESVRAEAHQNGVVEGQRAAAERVRTAIEAVRAVVDELRAADGRREKEAADRIVALAAAVASHLVEREVRVVPDIMSDLVRRAVAEFPVNEALTVHLNPSDLALLSSGLSADSAREHLTSGQVVNWVPDPSIRSGGCLVEGGDRIVDARLSRILDRIVRALVDD